MNWKDFKAEVEKQIEQQGYNADKLDILFINFNSPYELAATNQHLNAEVDVDEYDSSLMLVIES